MPRPCRLTLAPIPEPGAFSHIQRRWPVRGGVTQAPGSTHRCPPSKQGLIRHDVADLRSQRLSEGDVIKGKIRVWKVATGEERYRILEDDCSGVVLSPDGRTLASMGNGSIRLWDM